MPEKSIEEVLKALYHDGIIGIMANTDIKVSQALSEIKEIFWKSIPEHFTDCGCPQEMIGGWCGLVRREILKIIEEIK